MNAYLKPDVTRRQGIVIPLKQYKQYRKCLSIIDSGGAGSLSDHGSCSTLRTRTNCCCCCYCCEVVALIEGVVVIVVVSVEDDDDNDDDDDDDKNVVDVGVVVGDGMVTEQSTSQHVSLQAENNSVHRYRSA